MPTIALYIETKYTDEKRPFCIEIDGYKMGSIKAGESSDFPIETGNHNIQLTLNGACSNLLRVDATSRETICLVGGSALREWRLHLGRLFITIWRKRYLWINDVPPP